MKKKILTGLGTLLILLAVNYSIYQKEKVIDSGTPILLKLAPIDPRSLIQGDYMILRYGITGNLPKEGLEKKGRIVLKLDHNQVGHFSRIDTGSPLKENEHMLIYRNRNGVNLGAESYMFQEGDADLYNHAKYGMLKVDKKGNSVLMGLCDQDFKRLGMVDIP